MILHIQDYSRHGIYIILPCLCLFWTEQNLPLICVGDFWRPRVVSVKTHTSLSDWSATFLPGSCGLQPITVEMDTKMNSWEYTNWEYKFIIQVIWHRAKIIAINWSVNLDSPMLLYFEILWPSITQVSYKASSISL